jgi:hypothetical protein
MKYFIAAYTVFFFLPYLTYATPIPDTGQTKCYDDSVEITCPEPGEPFYGQDGNYTINPQSYTKLDINGNDLPDEAIEWIMVRDNVTRLIWEVKTDDSTIHDRDFQFTWARAMEFGTTLNSQNWGGYTDWRLPTVKELSFIVNRDMYHPSISSFYFPNTMASHHWSSTTFAIYPIMAWIIDFHGGGVTYYFKSHYGPQYGRAVRGGQCGSLGNFIDNKDGTITDTDTGLMWQQEMSQLTYIWEEALHYANTLLLAGYDDWRLPNANELQSLVDYNRIPPTINTTYFPNTIASTYWSSTSYSSDPSGAWIVDFGSDGGVLYVPGKSYYKYVRAVRGGQCESFGDIDSDCRIDCIDNCQSAQNPDQKDNDEDGIGDVCDMCPNDHDNDIDSDSICGDVDNCPNNANPDQTDTFPPQGNDIGNACDCEADFDCDRDVDGTDATTFKLYFGRNPLFYPCNEINPCRGDFGCDVDVDGTDAALFKEDFGRSWFSNPCPACEVGEWCAYP